MVLILILTMLLIVTGKRKDYFTSALPWTQKINDGTVVNIGLGCFYVLILGVVFLLAVLAVIAIIVC